jgi:hypothetical protein
MLVTCQVCTANVSDQAVGCPKCSSEKSAFLGPETDCYECGAPVRAAYQTCSECGAPQSKSPLSEPGSFGIELRNLQGDAGYKEADDSSFANDGMGTMSKQRGGPLTRVVRGRKISAKFGLKKPNRWSDPDEMTYLPTVVSGAAGGLAALGLNLGAMGPALGYLAGMALAQTLYSAKFLRSKVPVHWVLAVLFAISAATVSAVQK